MWLMLWLRSFEAGKRAIPGYPEALFPLKDGRSERKNETDELLIPKHSWILDCLEMGWSPQSIFEELSTPVPRTNFYRYLHRQGLMEKARPKNIVEIIHSPGEALLIDWGKLFDVIDPRTGKKKTIWFFAGVLGHSRYGMVRIVEKLDFATTMELIMSMFEELGGVPRKVICDNPKVFTREASEYEPLKNPAFERFASHYNFTVEALPPGAPEKKGKVERLVPVMRRMFESYDSRDYSLESAQAHCDRKLKLFNDRKHGTHLQKPIEVFINTEADKLKPLPPLRYELETIITSKVRADGYVRYANKYYRIDINLKGEQALLIANTKSLAIYCFGRLLEVYELISDPYVTKACKDHYRECWERTIENHGHYLERAKQIGGNVERFVGIILARGDGFVDTRVVWGLLTLNKKYNNEDIDKACLSALELSQVNLATVRQLLNTMAKPLAKGPTPEDVTVRTVGGKFARPMSEYKNHLKLVYSKN